MKVVLILSVVLQLVFAKEGFGPTDQEWGYVTVREGAHLFWWLHYTTANVQSYYEKPLIIWLQGGPGASSTGYGNFAEIGPLDGDMNSRNTSWVNHANLLLVDNPVGTGFSYVENITSLTVTNREIAEDFLVFLKDFYNQLPKFKETPLYIFSEAYGGKMAAEISLVLYNAIQNGEIDCQLRGLGLGDAWISPIDIVLTWAPYLLKMAYIDQFGYESIERDAKLTAAAYEAGNYMEATMLWGRTKKMIRMYTGGIDFNNILIKIPYHHGMKRDISFEELEIIMNEQVAPVLGLDQIWQQESGQVYSALMEDFMKPATKIVEELLNDTDITVAVYNGHLDLNVNTPGTIKWVEELNWKNSSFWGSLSTDAFAVDDIIEGYEKKLHNFHYYTILRAGHMVPVDNPKGMLYILQEVTNNFSVNVTTLK